MTVTSESTASYCLVSVIPSATARKSLSLNLAFVFDVSVSMNEEDGTDISRLRRIQKVARWALDTLKPNDTVAVVGFGYNAQCILPSTSISDKAKIMDVIDKVDRFEVDPGGNSMDQGMQLAIDEVAKKMGAGRLSQVVVLTCGNTSGEAICRQLARTAAQKKIHLTLMGVGTEWNSALIMDLAKLSGGKWYYLGGAEYVSKEADHILAEEFKRLASDSFFDARMYVRPVSDVEIKRICQVSPAIRQLHLSEPQPRFLVSDLGTLRRDQSSHYILELTLPKRPDGQHLITELGISFDPGTGKRESATTSLRTLFTSASDGKINTEVAKHMHTIGILEG